MKPEKLILHCTATPNGKYVDPEVIRKDHKAKGWDDIGYHILINTNGEIFRGRALNVPGAHTKGENSRSIGIALVGTDKFTHRQWAALRNQLDGLSMIYDFEVWDVWGHAEFDSARAQGKTCPNIRLANLIAWYSTDDDKAIKDYICQEGIS